MANGNRSLGEMSLLDILKGGAQTGGQMIQQQVTQDNPLAVLARIIGGLGAGGNPLTTPVGDVTRNVAAGVGPPQPQVPLSPRKTKALEKIVNKGINEQAEEFVSIKGLDAAESILEKMDQSQGVGTQAISPPAAGNQPDVTQSPASATTASTQAPQTATGGPQAGQDGQGGVLALLNNLISLGGFIQPTERNRLLGAQADLAEQKLAGKTPLQKGDKEKLEIESFNNLMTTGNKALSAETAKLVGNVESGITQLNLLEEAFTKNEAILATPGFNNSTSQIVGTMVEDLTDIIGRLRSGGAINAEEQKNFLKQIPKRGIVAGRIEKPETVRFKINKLRKLFTDIKSKAQPNNELPRRIQAAVQAGFTREEIMARLKAKGQI